MPRTEQIQFRKLPSGAWGVWGPTSKLKLGAEVDVTLRDGTTERVTVKAVVSTHGEMALAAVNREWR